MMPDYFVQTELNVSSEESKTIKLRLLFSYSFKLLALICLGLTFYSLYAIIPAVITFLTGVLLRQSVLQRIEAFEYFLVKDRLKISKRTNFGVQTVMADILVKNVISLEENKDLYSKDDIIAAPSGKSIMKLGFLDNSTTKNLYFAPSDYMIALIREKADL